MSLSCPCPHCGHTLRVNEKFAGRKALCSQCEGVVAIPRAGVPGVGGSKVHDPAAAVSRSPGGAGAASGSLLEEARAFAALAVEHALLTRGRADQCVAWYEKLAARKGASAPHFADALLEQGALGEEQVRELTMAMNRRRHADVSSVATATAGSGTRECPNCFEIIQKKSRSCRFCGANLQEPELCDQCPNCSGTQPPGGALCQTCGVDIRTGLYAGMQKRRCPRCGVLASGLESVCAVCRTPLDKARAAVQAEKIAGSAVSFVRGLVPIAILIALAAGAFWVYKNWGAVEDKAREQAFGKDEAALRARIGKFGEAIVYRDYEGARAMLASEGDVEAALGRVAGVKEAGESVSTVALTKIQMDGTRATAYVDVTIKPPEKPKDPADLGALIGGGPKERVAHMTWKWALKDGQWKYAGPL